MAVSRGEWLGEPRGQREQIIQSVVVLLSRCRLEEGVTEREERATVGQVVL